MIAPAPAEERVFRRILVALDASAPSLAALEAAADLAFRLRAELAGLFVEDEDLMRLAALPFARAFSPDAADLSHIDPEAMRRALRAQADRARRALEAVARRHRVTSSFRVARGQTTTTLLEAARDFDLLGLGKAGGTPAPRARLGGTARVALARCQCATLMLQRDGEPHDRVVALFTGSDRALAVAVVLARDLGAGLDVAAVGADAATVARLEAEARAWVAAHAARATFTTLVESDWGRLAKRLGRRGLVVAAPAGLLATERARESLAEVLEAPLLLLRR
jgi:nucleotide-binding universal stress UspA family protein